MVFVMAPQRDAHSAQQPIAVLQGSAVNQDGRSSSLTAPNGPSQSKLVANALAAGDVEPACVSLIAVHGTGALHTASETSCATTTSFMSPLKGALCRFCYLKCAVPRG